MTLSFDTAKLRPYFVKALLASLVVAAGAGIFTLLFGTFDTIEARILVTTLLIGLYSITTLCCMAVFNSRYALWGLIGIGASTLSLALGLIAAWVEFGSNWDVFGQLVKYFAIFGIIGVSVSHQSLLLRLTGKATRNTQMLILATVAVIGVVATMLVLPLLLEDFELGEAYWRMLGVFAILDVLGTIVVPVTARIESRRNPK